MDHVGGCVAPRQFRQRLQHGIEHAGRDPSSIAPEHAVPLAILVRQVSPLRTGPRDPHHAFEIGAVILRRTAATTPLRTAIRLPNLLSHCLRRKRVVVAGVQLADHLLLAFG